MSQCDAIYRLLGRLLRKSTVTKEADQALDEYGADSWVEGGCHVFAAALQKWLGGLGEPMTMTDNVFSHVMLKIGNCYFDASGAYAEKDVLKRFKTVTAVDIESLEVEWPVANELVKIFERVIGSGSEVAADLR